MTKFWAMALAAAAIAATVWVLIRPQLKKQPWMAGFFAAVEPMERWIYLKSESILMARIMMFLGSLLELLTFAGSIDFAPLVAVLPPGYEWVGTFLRAIPTITLVLGFIVEKNRRTTTQPLSAVAISPDASPEAREAAAEIGAAAKQTDELIKKAA